MAEVETTAGTIEYEDTGGDGPVLVLLHGLAMDGRLWRKVIPELAPEHRCVTPTLPFGTHRKPMRGGADLSLGGIGRIVAEFIDGLGVDEVTLVFAGVMTFRTLGGEYSGRDREGIVAASLFWYATIAVYAVVWYAVYVTK